MSEKTVSARVLSNTSILMTAQMVTKLLGMVLTIATARILGVEDYGLYAFALTFGNAFGLLASFGLAQLLPREVARRPESSDGMLGTVLLLEAIMSTLALGLLLALALALGYTGNRFWIVALAGAAMIVNAVLNVMAAYFRGHHRMDLEAVTRISLSVLNLSIGLPVLLAGFGVLGLATVQLAVFSGMLAVAIILATRKLARPSFDLGWMGLGNLLRLAGPFVVLSLLIFAYDGTATIFLSLLRGDYETGLYSGAMSFVRVFLIVPAALIGALLPLMAHSWQASRTTWTMLYRRSIKYLLMVGLPLAMGLTLLSSELVAMVLGAQYGGSAVVLQVLAWVLLVDFLNHGYSNALISIDRERVYLRIVTVAMVVYLLLTFSLIPGWGALGAAVASLTTESVILIVQGLLLRRNGIRLDSGVTLLKPVVSVTIMAMCLYLARHLALPLQIVVGVTSYSGVLLSLRPFDDEELAPIRDLWKTLGDQLARRLRRKPVRSV